jgi:hypothetical protein
MLGTTDTTDSERFEPSIPIVERLQWLERVSDPADPLKLTEVIEGFE